jgi:IS30 family transposase
LKFSFQNEAILQIRFGVIHRVETPPQRGTNENTNGLIREYFPKGSDFVPITQKAIDDIIEKRNSHPRKRLGFLPPRQVFFA